MRGGKSLSAARLIAVLGWNPQQIIRRRNRHVGVGAYVRASNLVKGVRTHLHDTGQLFQPILDPIFAAIVTLSADTTSCTEPRTPNTSINTLVDTISDIHIDSLPADGITCDTGVDARTTLACPLPSVSV